MSESGTTNPVYMAVYRHGVDEKRRVQIPSKWRAAGPDQGWIMVLWPDTFEKNMCLMLFPPSVFQKVIENLAAKPFNDSVANSVRRFVGQRADTVTLDKAGRICLPEEMAKAVGIDKEAVLVGCLDRYQIWNPERFKQTQAGVDQVAGSVWQQF